MTGYSFYSAILGLSSEWRISDVTMDKLSGKAEIHIVSSSNSFRCDICGATILPSGTRKARWFHDNNFNIRFYISALIPLVTCPCCGEMKVRIPWEQAGTVCKEPEHEDSQSKDEPAP